jgi:hypothetical protein
MKAKLSHLKFKKQLKTEINSSESGNEPNTRTLKSK